MKMIFALLFATSLFCSEIPKTSQIEINGVPLTYSAEVGTLKTKNENLEEVGELGYISYTVENEGALQKRPLTFVFNGGPGSSSVWLHMGAFGPKRVLVSDEKKTVSPPYELVDNEETLLDLTDLVFIDPMGTGLSSAEDKEEEKKFYDSVRDVESVGDFIRDYLTEKGRWNSPIYIAVESYGTARASSLGNYLQSHHGIYLNGLILISCAIDFQTFIDGRGNFLPYPLYLPTYAASSWYHGRYRSEATLEEVLEEAKQFALEEYLPFLFSQRVSQEKKQELFQKLSLMTGLPLSVIEKGGGKVSDDLFFYHFFPQEKKVIGRFDTRCTGNYVSPFHWNDPSASNVLGPFSTAFHAYLQDELKTKANYCILSMKANASWSFSKTIPSWGGYPYFMDDLRQALVTNPSLKLFVASGYFDAATPFFATEFCINQLDLPESYYEKIQMEYFEGGHMFYLGKEPREKFKKDLIRFYAPLNETDTGIEILCDN